MSLIFIYCSEEYNRYLYIFPKNMRLLLFLFYTTKKILDKIKNITGEILDVREYIFLWINAL